MGRIILFLGAIFVSMNVSYGQCGITVDAGDDYLICMPGESVVLNGAASGANISSIEWIPSAGLSDPNSLTPTATVFGPTTYTLTVQTFDPNDNEIQNGDFSSGTSGWTSDYVPGFGGTWGNLSSEGTYAVSTNPNFEHSNFASCSDFSGDGNMLVINGATTPNEAVWCQTVTVTPNTDFIFNAWVTSVISSNPAILQFSINGTLLGSPYSPSSATCVWGQFYQTWNSGGSTSAEICIVNQNTTPSGNDFAIDDIFFGEVCEQTDDVFIDMVTLIADAPAVAMIPCSGDQNIVLDGSASSSGPNITYEWTTFNGFIVSGANSAVATINTAGVYTLTVTYQDGNNTCTAMTDVIAIEDTNVPFANILAPDLINCINSEVILNATGSSVGSGIIYNWTSPDGNIVSGNNASQAVVNAVGYYELEVINTMNGCSDMTFVFVGENMDEPQAVIAGDPVLDCENVTVSLDASSSSVGNGLIYTWTTPDGNILAGANNLNPVVNASGTYYLNVFNSLSGCSADTLIEVNEDFSLPVIDISNPEYLTCTTAEVIIDATNSMIDTAFVYSWSTMDGNILSGDSTLLLTVDSIGTYELNVYNSGNGCTHTEAIEVEEDLVKPIAEAGNTQELDCDVRFVTVSAAGSSQGNQYTYNWMNASGNSISGQINGIADVDQPGFYFLQVSNAINGCTSLDSVEITQNDNLPIAFIDYQGELNCAINNLTLDASTSSTGSNYTFEWFTDTGNFLSGQNTLTPQVDAPGQYWLQIVDTVNDCEAMDTVMLTQNITPPDIDAGVVDTLNCFREQIQLSPSPVLADSSLIYQWTTTNGNIIDDPNQPNPSLDEPGQYYIEVVNTENACVSIDSVMIEQDIEVPVALADSPLPLDCQNTSREIDATNSSTGAEFFYQWTTIGGAILSGAQTLNPNVGDAGEYSLTVIDSTNFCISEVSVAVAVDTLVPIVQIASAELLTCDRQQLSLNAQGSSSGADMMIQWTTADGNILNGDAGLQPQINAPGIYHLSIINEVNDCENNASVVVDENITDPLIAITPPDVIHCNQLSVELQGQGMSVDNDLTYQWSTVDGNIISASDQSSASVNQSGAYLLEIRDNVNGCTSDSMVLVDNIIAYPNIEINEPDTINCANTSIILNALASSMGASFYNEWSTLQGNIVTGHQGLNPEVNAGGTYLLSIIDSTNFCVSDTIVNVVVDTVSPSIIIQEADILTCDREELSLDAVGSSDGNEMLINWSTLDGNVLSGSASLLPEVNAPGTYTLSITDQGNACNTSKSITVAQNIELPIVMIEPAEEINCYQPEINLMGEAIASSTNLTLNWSSVDGNILSPANMDVIAINQEGTYQLEVVNNENGCTNDTSIVVLSDLEDPVAIIQSADTITCQNTSVLLDASLSSSGMFIEYLWTTTDGNIVQDMDTPTPEIDAVGLYQLLVTNTDNGCTSIGEARVFEDVNDPIISIAEPDVLTCLLTEENLDASVTSSGGSFDLNWSTVGGNILSVANEITASIDEPGTYVLHVIDTENGCDQITSVEVIQDIQIPVVAVMEDFELKCTEDFVSLSASVEQVDQYTLNWSSPDGNIISGAQTLTPVIDAIGTYHLLVTNTENGCTEEDQLVVTQNIISDFDFTYADPSCLAPQGFITFDEVVGGTSPYVYSIDGGAQFNATSSFTNLEAGTYPLLIQDINGCEIEDEITILPLIEFEVDVEPRVFLQLGDDYTIHALVNVQHSEIASIQWSPEENLDCSDCLSPTINPLETTGLTVTVTTHDGCVDQASIQIFVEKNVELLFPNAFSPNEDGNNDYFFPFTTFDDQGIKEILSFQIFNRWGEMVFENYNFQPNDPAHGWDGYFRGQTLNPAVFVYYATVQLIDGNKKLYKGDVVLKR